MTNLTKVNLTAAQRSELRDLQTQSRRESATYAPVQRLVELGFAVRIPDPKPGILGNYAITPAGTAWLTRKP
jgi:hypothetical protein